MLYDPKTQLDLVRQRHTDLRAVAGHGRLFGRRRRSASPAPTPTTAPVAPPATEPVPVIPLRLA